jgi:type IV secretion system protein VirB6
MDEKKLATIAAMVGGAIILIIVLWIIAIIGAMDLTDGCLYRYNIGNDGALSTADKLTNTVTLKANANYTALSSSLGPTSNGLEVDPTTYGKWLNTNLRVTGGQKVRFVIKGEVSLCKAYLPINNLQSTSDKDKDGQLIPIPRTSDKVSPPVTVYFDAKTDQWRNLTQIFKNDHLVVSLVPDQKGTATTSRVYNSIEKGAITADCSAGKRSYNPICGRYSLWDYGSTYVSSCSWKSQCYKCNCRDVCNSWNLLGWCTGGWTNVCDWCGCYENVHGTAPEPYGEEKYISPRYEDISSLITDFNPSCRNNQSYVDGDYQNKKYFWFSADNAAGLLYRFDTNINPSSASTRGSDYSFAEIASDQSFHAAGEDYKIIMNTIYTQRNIGYLQYRFHDNDGVFADNTGGYVLNIKQTKCRRTNGNGFNDVVEGRGVVQYVITNYGASPNASAPSSVQNILVDANGSGEFDAPSDADGYLWLKIKNDANDYQDSFGQYDVQFFTSVETGAFYKGVLDPFFTGLKNKIKDASVTIFKNMTCYKGIGGSENCTNFFQYIKFMLILYIMLYGMMFLMGMVKISQNDLVIRVIKVGLVAGLINDSTFEFFNSYVFDFVTGFSDDIMANMSGYSTFSGNTSVSNPFMFLDAVMTKIFFSSTFAAQMMALLSMGLNGVFYFILLFVCMGIIIIVAFRAIAVYLMAFMAIAVLIGLAPLFLTFILFERTWYLFDNWVKFMTRYMLEPIIMLAGIIILTQLFTIYLDYVVGYSVCWKCAIPIKIPFPQIDGITPAFLDVELFCINWFAPWGFDHRSSSMGMNMQNMVVLLMIAYCMWGYIDFSNKIVARLAGGSGGPSATGMGASMSGAIESKALSKVGLDAQSRANIKNEAKSRAKSMRRGDKNEPLSKGNRKDKTDSGNNSEASSVAAANSNATEQNANTKNNKVPDTDKPSSWKSAKPKTDDANKKSNIKIGEKASRVVTEPKDVQDTPKDALKDTPKDARQGVQHDLDVAKKKLLEQAALAKQGNSEVSNAGVLKKDGSVVPESGLAKTSKVVPNSTTNTLTSAAQKKPDLVEKIQRSGVREPQVTEADKEKLDKHKEDITRKKDD